MDNERGKIDEIDQEVARLLQERAELARQIGEFKAQQGQSTFDPAREAEVQRAVSQVAGVLSPAQLGTIFSEIISACRAVEQPLHIAFLGPEHTFTHLAARQQFGSQVVLEPAVSIPDIFRLVEAERCSAGVVPVENSTGGVVPETLDNLLETELKICAEVHLPVHLSVLASGPLAEVCTLYSHPQPLSQCRRWLQENLPAVEVKVVSSTAAAAQEAGADPTGAALSPAEAAPAYGLQVLATNLEDFPNNRTRFFVIGSQDARPTGRDKTSMVFSTAHRPGALHEAMGAFSRHGLNLTLIQSRPLRGQRWQYVFFVDFEGHREEPAVQQALAELQQHSSLLKVLGSYPAEQR